MSLQTLADISYTRKAQKYLPYEALESVRLHPLERITGAHLICLGGAPSSVREDVHSGEHRLNLKYPENVPQCHETGIGAKRN